MKNLILLTALFSFNIFSSESTDRIVIAKDVITLDTKYQNANAIFIKGNKIHAVGPKENLIKEFPTIRVDNLSLIHI